MNESELSVGRMKVRDLIPTLTAERVPLGLVRRLMLANGLSILAVVAHHAASWGFVAMFWWADSFRQVNSIPFFGDFGSLPYYVLTAILVLTQFSVPTFLFVSGYFMAYALGGSASVRGQAKTLRTRLSRLLIPYLLWSVVIFAGRWLESCEELCQLDPIGSYGRRLLLGNAVPAYYYVFLLAILLVLTPLLLRLARTRWRLLLGFTGLLHLAVILPPYMRLLEIGYSPSKPTGPIAILGYTAFYFASGLVYRTHLAPIKRSVERVKQYLPFAVVLFGVLSFVDIEWFYRLEGHLAGHNHRSLFTSGYAISVILSFVAFRRLSVPGARQLMSLGSKVYGVYLLHVLVLEVTARAVHRLVPQLLAFRLTFELMLVVMAIGFPLIFMRLVERTRLKRAYRYLFG